MKRRIREKLKKNFECGKFIEGIESPFYAVYYCGERIIDKNDCKQCKKFKPNCIWYPTNKRLREIMKLGLPCEYEAFY